MKDITYIKYIFSNDRLVCFIHADRLIEFRKLNTFANILLFIHIRRIMMHVIAKVAGDIF